MNDDELHESFYRGGRYKESPTERYARLLAEAPSVLGEHEFALDTDVAEGWSPDHGRFFEVWRWLCSCGERGNWQSVSGDAAERGWREHVEGVG